jgi:hypothetical protein
VSHVEEIGTNAVNVGISIAIVCALAVLLRILWAGGRHLLIARLFLQQKATFRGGLLLILGLGIFLASNVLELYGDVYHIDWVANEIVETASLAVMLAGLFVFVRILRVPTGVQNTVQVETSEVRTET